MASARRVSRVLGITFGAVLVGTLVTVGPPAGAELRPQLRPTAIVSLGDNGIAGEGVGNYVPGTDGENGNWCHRSYDALVHKTDLAHRSFNLACSGAKSVNVSLADSEHYTEGSQARRLMDIARNYRVTTVIVRVGSNDDPNFSETVARCIRAYLYPDEPSCASQLRPEWPGRLSRMAAKVTVAVYDVQRAMTVAGYSRHDYTLVLTSYASPITEQMDAEQQENGCPFRLSDAQWGRTEAVPQLNDALRGVAESRGVRFLDLSRATEGREACSGGDDPSSEWQTRITVDPWKLVHGELTPEERHRAAESFHPNALAHKQIGRCMEEFVNSRASSASCVEGSDGKLHPIPG